MNYASQIDKIIQTLEDDARKLSANPNRVDNEKLALDIRGASLMLKKMQNGMASYQRRINRARMPLTKAELMQMKGQPVWTVGVSAPSGGDWAEWDIVESADEERIYFGYSTEICEWWNHNVGVKCDEDGGWDGFGWACYRCPVELSPEALRTSPYELMNEQ